MDEYRRDVEWTVARCMTYLDMMEELQARSLIELSDGLAWRLTKTAIEERMHNEKLATLHHLREVLQECESVRT